MSAKKRRARGKSNFQIKKTNEYKYGKKPAQAFAQEKVQGFEAEFIIKRIEEKRKNVKFYLIDAETETGWNYKIIVWEGSYRKEIFQSGFARMQLEDPSQQYYPYVCRKVGHASKEFQDRMNLKILNEIYKYPWIAKLKLR